MDIDVEQYVKNIRVLVIDESEKERKIICSALEAYGFIKDNLHCCHDVEEAEQYIDSVQVIFLEASEQRCENAGGYDMHAILVRWKKKDKSVFVSAYQKDLGKFTRPSAIYAEQYIPKPLNNLVLLRALDLWAELSILDIMIEDVKGGIYG